MDQSDALSLFGINASSRQHQLGQSRESYEAANAHTAAPADEEPAASFWQLKESAAVGNPTMRRCRKLETSADHSAMKGGNDGRPKL
jgi:Tfp pilus assembly protein PilV